MEGLIAAVAELLIAPFFAGIAALCQLIGTLVSLALQVIFSSTASTAKRKLKVSPAFIKWIRRVILSSMAIFTATLLAINFLFLEESLRFVIDKVEDKSGFEIRYDSVEGNIFSGSFSFTGLELKQTLPDKPQLAIKAQQVTANLSVWDFIFGSRVLDSATVSQAEIRLQTLPKEKEEKNGIGFAIAWGDKGLDAINISKSNLLKSPNYVVNNLQLSDISINVDDRSKATPTRYKIEIDDFQAQPIRSHFAIFDLLFRSYLDGTLNGSRLTIVNTDTDGQRQTKWATRGISVATLTSLVGGPFHLFESGKVDVEVTDQWEYDSVENLDLDWKIKIADARAHLPAGTPELLKPLAQVWVDNINENEEDWEFGFQLQFSESQFKGASSLNAQQIWANSIPVFLKQASEGVNIEESTIKEKTKSVFDAVKGFIEKRKEKE